MYVYVCECETNNSTITSSSGANIYMCLDSRQKAEKVLSTCALRKRMLRHKNIAMFSVKVIVLCTKMLVTCVKFFKPSVDLLVMFSSSSELSRLLNFSHDFETTVVISALKLSKSVDLFSSYFRLQTEYMFFADSVCVFVSSTISVSFKDF